MNNGADRRTANVTDQGPPSRVSASAERFARVAASGAHASRGARATFASIAKRGPLARRRRRMFCVVQQPGVGGLGAKVWEGSSRSTDAEGSGGLWGPQVPRAHGPRRPQTARDMAGAGQREARRRGIRRAGPQEKTRGSLGGAKGKAGTSREDPRGGRDPRRAGGGGRCAEPLERGLGISGFSAFGGRDLGRRERRGGPGAAGRAARPELWPAGRRSARGGRFHRQPPAGKCGALKKCGASCARGVGRAKFATRVVRAKTQ